MNLERIGELEIKDGYNGGIFRVISEDPSTTNILGFLLQNTNLVLGVNIDKRQYHIPVRVVNCTGVDNDHGHTYHWTSFDIMMLTYHPALDIISTSLRSFLKQHDKFNERKLELFSSNESVASSKEYIRYMDQYSRDTLNPIKYGN